MKLKQNSIFLALALVAAGCSESEETVVNPNATPGEEVQFGSSLAEGTVTRTVYGEPSTDSYPVYWVNDDRVIVTSPQCMEGFNNREYSITVNSETQNYASSPLTKTAETGIRWSDDATATADFYSVYPYKNVMDVDESLTKFELRMPSTQNITLKTTTDADGKVTHNNYDAADMDACFMWAKTAGVASGQTVNLQYNPFSTALRFTLRGPETAEEDPVTVTKVEIKANTEIAGDFKVELKEATNGTVPTVSDIEDASETVTLVAKYENGTNLTLAYGEEAQLNAFIIPKTGVDINGWTITVTTSDQDENTFSKTITSSNTTGGTGNITAGQVHDLGYLPYLSKGAWKLEKWMTELHNDVYLSEVSMPGSWNSLNSNFQNNTSISEQYKKGIRAFHLDTRWKKNDWFGNSYTLGVCNNGNSPDNVRGGKVLGYYSGAPTITSALSSITRCVKSDEYMVVMCTFANDSYEYNGSGGWIKAISTACDTIGEVVIDASKIDKNTTVGEVEGHVIVIICTDDKTLTLPEGSKCMMTYLPNTIESESSFAATQNDLLNVSKTTNLLLYGTQAQITSNSSTAGIKTSDRGWAPTIDNRKTLANEILSDSKNNYSAERAQSESYNHNEWLYLGLGGYIVTNTSASEASNGTYTLANDFNPWIKGIIDDMATAKYFYPVGIVLMNHVCEDNGAAAANAIVQLNTRYEMAKKSTTTTSSGVKARTQPSYKSGGNAISH